jgi:hypothetical protein
MKKLFTLVTLTASLLFSPTADAQTLIAGWDFQTTNTGGTAVIGATNTPTVFVANFGSGTLYFDGSNGSSLWATNELNAFGGSTNNLGAGFSSVTTSPAALALVNSNANGKFAVFKFDLTGVFDPIAITFSSQRTASGFTNQLWEFSTDGVAYNSIGNVVAGTNSGTMTTAFNSSGVLSLPSFSGLSNAANAHLRVTFTGATSGTGNNRWDNIQVTAVPEPSTVAMLSLAGLGFAGYLIRRRHRG